jgi:hypothetical protein
MMKHVPDKFTIVIPNQRTKVSSHYVLDLNLVSIAHREFRMI